MATHYSKVLSSGQKVEIDDVNVTVDDSRYPTRNISAVHLRRAENPGVITAIFLIAVGIIFGTRFILSSLGITDQTQTPFAFILYSFVFIFLGLKKISKLRKICHAVTFGSSGTERDAILVHALQNNGLLDIIKAGFAWEESTQESYNEIKSCSNSISDAIDELQRKES